MRSSVNGTCGSMVRIERVRKSSAGIEGIFMVEKDLAALRSARRLAVKFDLNADLNGPNILGSFLSSTGEASKTVKSKFSESVSHRYSGCSSCSPGGEDTGVRDFLVGRSLRPLGALYGVSPGDSIPPVENESVRDGTDSQETVREVDIGDAMVLSPMDRSSSSKSSGGLNKTSRGPLMKFKLSSFSEV